MRGLVLLLVALAAFAAGFFAGHAASPDQRARGARDVAVTARGAARRPAGEEATAHPETGRGAAAGTAAGPAASDARPVDEAARWFVGPEEFVLWYRVHEKAYDLPPADDGLLEAFGHDVILALHRIPRPDLLTVLLARYRRYQPLRDGSREEMVRGLQHFLDDLHRTIAYSDYLLIAWGDHASDWVEDGDVAVRPLGAVARPGADPYARPDLWASEREHFRAWYRAYRHELGFPKRDEEFLDEFCRDVVYPLDRVPRPELLRALLDVYEPYYAADPRGVSREEWAPLARRLYGEFERILPPLDYERMRRSDRWEVDCRELGILPG